MMNNGAFSLLSLLLLRSISCSLLLVLSSQISVARCSRSLKELLSCKDLVMRVIIHHHH
jgi:hypothetical protein